MDPVLLSEMLDEKYTGTKGLYVHAKVPSEFAELIADLGPKLALERPDVEELHCTLMYSRDTAPEKLPRIKTVHNALVTSVQSWVGFDKSTYVVADVHSMSLIQAHAVLARAGAEHSFASFSPHITLAKMETAPDGLDEKIELLNRELKVNPIHVVFIGVEASDVKGD